MLVQFPSNTTMLQPVKARKILRQATVTVTDTTFHDETPQKTRFAAEPIKSVEDINKVTDYLVTHGRYRDNLLFIAGINLGLRCGDLLHLKIGQILTPDGTAYRDRIEILEEKTSGTRKVQKTRVLYMNDAVVEAANLYFEHRGPVSLNDWLFAPDGNRSKNSGEPLTVRSVERILKEVINDKCGIEVHASTHCLRKTFAYHTLMNAKDRSRALEFLQKIFGHSSQQITLYYAGITDEEVKASYEGLNLGKRPVFQLPETLLG